tara:strand:- start:288 stop:3104 length:2817 start_codon:yes stop_codon:yes gene_type:complete
MAEKKKIPNLQKKMNKTLEQFFEAKKGGQQPVGTSVNPLGAFRIKPMVQDFSRPVSFPTPLPQKPFNFKPIFSTDKTKDKERGDDHPGKDKKSKLVGQAAPGKDRSFGLIGDDHLGNMPRPKIEGEMAPGRDKSIGLPTPEKPAKTKAFSIPGDEHEPKDPASSLEGQAHTPKDRAFGLKGGDHKGATINSPFGQTPEKPTAETNPIEPGPEHTTVEPIQMGQTPEKPTAEIPEMPATPEKSTAEIPAMPEPAEKEGYTPDESWNQPVEFTYPDNGTNGFDPSGVLKIHQDQASKDKKPWEGVAGDGTNWQHLNNGETRFIEAGDPEFRFSSTTPGGGSSIWAWTRGQYNTAFELTSNDGSNFSLGAGNGQKIPSLALSLPKGDLTGDGVEGKKGGFGEKRNFHEYVGNNKFVSLRDEAQKNNARAPLFMKSPFVQRGMQKGPGNDNPKGILEMINDLTAPVIDLVRVSKYLISPDGLLFMIKQQGLQMSNPKSEFGKDLHANRIFNPLAFALQVPANVLGIHFDRHNLGPLNQPLDIEYTELGQDDPGNNRLVNLIDEMGVGINYSGYTPGGVIDSLSGKMGPNSLFGIIGRTDIHSSTAGVGGVGIETSAYSPEVPYAKTYAKPDSEVKGGESTPNFQITVGADGREDYDADLEKRIAKLANPDTLPSPAAFGFPASEGVVDPKEEFRGSFKVHDYETMKKFRAQPKQLMDFRDPDGIAYKDNIISRLLLTDYGKNPGEASEVQDLFGDKPDDDNDFVKIMIESKDPALKVRARAYNLEVTDKLSPSYSSVSYAGNPAESHIFDKIGREFTIKFTVPSFSSQELKRNYLRLNNFMRLASPKITSGYASGNILELTLGHLFVARPIIINSFTHTYNNDQWDIAFGEGARTSKFELPMHYDIEIGGKFLDNHDGSVWNAEGTFFDDGIWADIMGEAGE